MQALLVLQALLPAVAALCLTVLFARHPEGSRNPLLKQIVCGVVFGALAAFATETGATVVDGGVLNVRDAAPLAAGLIFGAPAGAIAGAIGAVERWLCVMWGGGATTQFACSVAALVAGLTGDVMRRLVFSNTRPAFGYAFGIGVTIEVFHMVLVLMTNLSNLPVAFDYVSVCSVPMMALNGFAVGLAVLTVARWEKDDLTEKRPPRIANDLGFKLFMTVLVAFVAATAFIFWIVSRITSMAAAGELGVSIPEAVMYMTVFAEVIVFAAMFFTQYLLLTRTVVLDIDKIEDELSAIADGELDTKVNVRRYAEFDSLSSDVNATVDILKSYIEMAEHKHDAELELARQIQHSALPSVFPPYPGRMDFDLYAQMNAAREVGGDFYDFFLLNKHTLVVIIADVSGKGIPAALFMMRAKTMIHSLMTSGEGVAEAMTHANARLCEANDSEMFVTMWLGKIDLSSGTVVYANAGHNPPCIHRKGKSWEFLKDARPNFVLGGMEGICYSERELQLLPGDSLYLYTDGVTEAHDANSELFGDNRLLETLPYTKRTIPAEACEAVSNAVTSFEQGTEQSDDVTMLCLSLYALRSHERIVTVVDERAHKLSMDFVLERLAKLGISQAITNRVKVCLDELVTNVCTHSCATELVVMLKRVNSELFICIEDDGEKFDPTAATEPDVTKPLEERAIGGLGIHMVRKLTSRFEYERDNNVNRVTLAFDLD